MWTTIGHEWAVGFLERAISSERVAHAYLLTGQEHIGKTHLAKELAAALNCRQPDPPCGECRSCIRTVGVAHPDLALVEPDNGRVKIDQVRTLQRTLSLSPYEGKWRVCILTDFHRATREASNALLKTLEEPPSRVVMILTAVDASLLLPTIVSRCQLLPLRLVPEGAIRQALIDRYGETDERARLLARAAAGRVGWAVLAAQDPTIAAKREARLEQIVDVIGMGVADRVLAAERIARDSDAAELADLWQTWWRDVMLIAGGCGNSIVNLDLAAQLETLAEVCGLETARRSLRATQTFAGQLEHNVNVRLALEVLFLGWPRVSLAESALRQKVPA